MHFEGCFILAHVPKFSVAVSLHMERKCAYVCVQLKSLSQQVASRCLLFSPLVFNMPILCVVYKCHLVEDPFSATASVFFPQTCGEVCVCVRQMRFFVYHITSQLISGCVQVCICVLTIAEEHDQQVFQQYMFWAGFWLIGRFLVSRRLPILSGNML